MHGGEADAGNDDIDAMYLVCVLYLCDSSYLPPLAESQVNPSDVSFKPNTLRKDLFNGKTFIFLSAAQVCSSRICLYCSDC